MLKIVFSIPNQIAEIWKQNIVFWPSALAPCRRKKFLRQRFFAKDVQKISFFYPANLEIIEIKVSFRWSDKFFDTIYMLTLES